MARDEQFEAIVRELSALTSAQETIELQLLALEWK
jgi:hypothetical protein